MKTSLNKITLNLDKDAEVNVKGFIAPIEYTQRISGKNLRRGELK